MVPFTPWSDESIADKGLRNVAPTRAFPARRQLLTSKRIEAQLPVKFTGQPARSRLPRPLQAEVFEVNANTTIERVDWDLPIPGKKRHLPAQPLSFIKSFQNPAPRLLLAVINLAQIQHRTLDDYSSSTTVVFHNRPILVFLAVFEPPGAA
jgi:hypothetical protein